MPVPPHMHAMPTRGGTMIYCLCVAVPRSAAPQQLTLGWSKVHTLDDTCRNAGDAVLLAAVKAALLCTHVHPEGIDGAYIQAQAVAMLCKAGWWLPFIPYSVLKGCRSQLPVCQKGTALALLASSWQQREGSPEDALHGDSSWSFASAVPALAAPACSCRRPAPALPSSRSAPSLMTV